MYSLYTKAELGAHKQTMKLVQYYIITFLLNRLYRLFVHHQVRTVGQNEEVKIDQIIRVRHIERRLGLCMSKKIHVT